MEQKLSIRDRIVHVAGRLFYKQGYNVTGINQIIEEAGVAKASLYHHFPSKTDVLMAYMDGFWDLWLAALNKYIAQHKDPRKRLLAIFDFRIQLQERNDFGGCAFIKINDEVGATDPQVLKNIQQRKDMLREIISDLVKAVPHKQILTTQEMAHFVYLVMEGGITSASIYKDGGEIKKAQNLVRKLL